MLNSAITIPFFLLDKCICSTPDCNDGECATCECSTPGTGTVGQNQIKCSTGETRYCSADQECYATDKFTYGEWNEGCRIPGDWILRIFKYFKT